MNDTKNPIVIVGAGMAGLMAAHRLKRDGHDVVVLEKSRALGGRMATRRIQDAVFDHGAQYFTAKDPRFLEFVAEWQAAGVLSPWFEKHTEDGKPYHTFIGKPGMTAIAKHLAQGVNVRNGALVTRLEAIPNGWNVKLEDGESIQASGVLLTAPLPQALSILSASRVELSDESRAALSSIHYDPCVALLLRLDREIDLPNPAGFWQPETGNTIGWVADNHTKGISPAGYGLTIQLAPSASADFFEQRDEACFEKMRAAVQPYLGEARILNWQIKRWRYALVRNARTSYFQTITQSPPLLLAGDAFAGPRVEGAALSGLVAAEQLAGSLSEMMSAR